jgi:hypothetical protein
MKKLIVAIVFVFPLLFVACDKCEEPAFPLDPERKKA